MPRKQMLRKRSKGWWNVEREAAGPAISSRIDLQFLIKDWHETWISMSF
jgi:hypothetical protein